MPVSAAVSTLAPMGIVVERPMLFQCTGSGGLNPGAHTVLGYGP